MNQAASMRRLLEICVETPDGLMAARDGGADRIELCSALPLGGLTPSPGFMRFAAETGLTTRAMIRPHEDGFVYGPNDLKLMLADIDAARKAGLEGVVFGALTAEGALDVPTMRRLIRHAAGLRITLHRAVDLLEDPIDAVRFAIDHGVDAILTSGGAATAVQGLEKIRQMQATADGRVVIMPGGGVSSANVGPLLETGVAAVHGSCSRPVAAVDDRASELGFTPTSLRRTDTELVRALRVALDDMEAAS